VTQEHKNCWEVFSMRSVPWLYNEGQMQLRGCLVYSLETAVRRVEGEL
jgi:hypothetical protein